MASFTASSPPSLLRRFRVNGIRTAKTVLASTADVVGDWIYYYSILRLQNDNLQKYVLYLWIFCIVSSIMAMLLVCSIYINFFHSPALMKRSSKSLRRKHTPFGQCVKTALGFEMLIEDLPQFILTVLISYELGAITTFAVFNFTTSGLNLLFNSLDMIEIEEHTLHNESKDEDSERGYVKV